MWVYLASARKTASYSATVKSVRLVSGRLPWPRVLCPDVGVISKRLYRHISQTCCPWNVKFSQALAEDSPFRAREFIAGKDSLTLARDIRALDQDAFSAAFHKSLMKRAKLAGLRRNAAVALANADQ